MSGVEKQKKYTHISKYHKHFKNIKKRKENTTVLLTLNGEPIFIVFFVGIKRK